MQPITISIIEDATDYRRALQSVLNETPGFECSHTFETGEAAIREMHLAEPDIVLVDIQLPGLNGIEAIAQLKRQFPNIQFMVLTVSEDDEKIFAALAAGASGYLLKSTPPDRIIEAIRELHDGGSPMSAQIARKVVASFQKPSEGLSNPYEQLLTKREREILELLSKGRLYKQIADELYISLPTVKSHCHSIYEKLHVTTRTEAVNKYFSR